MKRDVKDCWVNNYNPHLLTAWNANIQYILDEYGCIMYMLSYISKPESEMSVYLKTIVKEMSPENETEREEMKGVLQAYSKHREVSAQESVARTCGLKMKSCSREVVFLQTGENPLKMRLPLRAWQNKRADSENVWMTGIPEKYRARPQTPEFDHVSGRVCITLQDCLRQGNRRLQAFQAILNNMEMIQKRTRGKDAIIRYARFSEKKDPENFYGRLLKLYVPHRSESSLKTEMFPTHHEFYKDACVRLPGAQ
ncbi:hypothetical protein DPEC_G00282880 [Dallia pectoralis]|uniref:Uncharacterized protein n=1 Tax=Dallia pectoralis TaxID=75939 RepID=A0ACC2FIZ2_DALPE|nr:hypothetical protein DPEC_G00282880 [Dallia pectoralis]